MRSTLSCGDLLVLGIGIVTSIAAPILSVVSITLLGELVDECAQKRARRSLCTPV